MTYLIDTDQVIWYLRGQESVVNLLQSLGKGNLGLSVVALAEVLEGIYNQPDETKRFEGLAKFLTGVKVVDVDERIAHQFAKIRSNLRQRGNLIENMDIFIAATAMVNDLVLVTDNKKDFERIKGLKLYKHTSS